MRNRGQATPIIDWFLSTPSEFNPIISRLACCPNPHDLEVPDELLPEEPEELIPKCH